MNPGTVGPLRDRSRPLPAPVAYGPADLVGFARRWFRYGGGPAEEIVARFGVPPRVYFRELLDTLDRSEEPADAASWTVREMRRVARNRLWVHGG
ncbi:hypothetical protein ACIGG9_29585 [Pseudonocardia alni]|uniref:hypothetical protein n=1 Tax=Pseudonocardia alni TaxID=33907 RepID=UPI0033F15689